MVTRCLHQGRVGGGILGLVSTNGLEVTRVGDDNGAGAVRYKLNNRHHDEDEDAISSGETERQWRDGET